MNRIATKPLIVWGHVVLALAFVAVTASDAWALHRPGNWKLLVSGRGCRIVRGRLHIAPLLVPVDEQSSLQADRRLARPYTRRASLVRWSRELGSFRDPSGFVFTLDGGLYRQVNATFSEHYRRLLASGLYDELVRDRLIVPHEEVPVRLPDAPPAAAVLKPEYSSLHQLSVRMVFQPVESGRIADARVAAACPCPRHGAA